MVAPRLGIFALVIFLILFTRTYSHRPIILRFQEFIKFHDKIVCLRFCWYLLAFEFIITTTLLFFAYVITDEQYAGV